MLAGQSLTQPPATPRQAALQAGKDEAAQLVEERRKLDETLWANEVAAQRHEQVFIDLWDRLRAAKDKIEPLANFPFASLRIGTPGTIERHDWDVVARPLALPGQSLKPADWRQALNRFRDQGYRVLEAEWHHSQFIPIDKQRGLPARSVVSMVLHVENAGQMERTTIKGKLAVEWSAAGETAGKPVPERIDAVDFRIVSRRGAPAFQPAFTETFTIDPSGRTNRPVTTHPILVYDLDGDGRSEFIAAGANRAYRNLGGGKFKATLFCRQPAPNVNAGVLADFNGDGMVDFLAGSMNADPRLFIGSRNGEFADLGKSITTVPGGLRLPTAVTAGDIDNDGDLDVWIGQYKPPYVGGSMPTPYYDANDGFPAVLLINDGHGKFTEATAAAGLEKKRLRRTYSASFVDLDGDHDLDLIVVSDFSGVDIYKNDGRGKFTDVTDALGTKRHLFGMSHTFGDYDLDGTLDAYIVGMSSTTARRLDLMQLGRQESQFADHNRLRSEMGYGNRLLLGRGGMLAPTKPGDKVIGDTIARTGWSWGSTTADFDNDGDPDIFVANGNRSGRSARDYCTRYWCHDAYTGSSASNPAAGSVLLDSLSELNRLDISWNGFEHDVLWMNERERGFLDVAFLMGVSFESDGRAVASDDLDDDGLVDLLVEDYSQLDGSLNLRVLRNQWPTKHRWIAVRLADGIAGAPPIGAVVSVLLTNGKRLVSQYSTGHSVWTQHAAATHFGLGDSDRVSAIEVLWQDGRQTRLVEPAVNKTHVASPPKR